MKNYIFLSLAALVLAAGCSNITQEPVKDRNTGRVFIRLGLSGDAGNGEPARTIIPGGITAGSLYYGLHFILGETSRDETIDSGLSAAVELAPGEWDLLVYGYDSAADRETGPEKAVLEGNASFTVASENSTAVTVDLAAAVAGTETGTFSYSIQFPTTVSSAVLTVSGISGGNPQSRNLLVNGSGNTVSPAGADRTATGTFTLSAGYYRTGLDLYDGTNSAIARRSEILHIAGGQTSNAVYTFAATNFAAGPISVAYNTDLPTTLAGILAGTAGEYMVALSADESCVPMPLAATTAGKEFTITILGNGHTLSLTPNTGRLFTISGGSGKVRLILQNITLQGKSANTASLVAVSTNGALTLNSGAVIKENISTSSSGGGVLVNGGAFTMNGGTVSGNSALEGGGVSVNAGTFTMNSGEVSGNTASGTPNSNQGGGGVFIYGGSFTMNGGAITHNNAIDGGGVCMDGSGYKTFTMNNGTVSYNTASSTSFLEGGGGVFVGRRSTFTMSGGEVSYNTTGGSGGGVLYKGETFILSGGAKVSNNTASQYGGGVFIYLGERTFTMSGGEITSNGATNDGGGVYVYYLNTFTMSGGQIANNTGSSSSNGVYVYYNATFTMSGGARVTGGNKVFLEHNYSSPLYSSITIGGAFTGSDQIAEVNLDTSPPSADWVGKNILLTNPAGSTIDQAIIGRFQLGNFINYGSSTPITGYKIDTYGRLVPQ